MAKSITEHFSDILKHLLEFSNEIDKLPNNQNDIENNIEKIKEKYKIEELKKGIETDIEQIENMLNETLQKKEEDENNNELSEEVRNVLIAMHQVAIDIHEHFLNIARNFIEYIDTLQTEILDSIKEQINIGVIKLEEMKEINKELEKIINNKQFEA